MEQKVNQIFTVEFINPLLGLIECSVIRLLQVHDRQQLLEEKLRLLGLYELDPKAAIENKNFTDLVALDLLSDVLVYKEQIKIEHDFLTEKGALLDLVEDGKLSWLGLLNNKEILWSWQVGDGCQIKYWRDTKDIFEKRRVI